METDVYWSVYKNLEKSLLELSFSIHVDDHQMGVYSSKITDLILRSAIEIESIVKDLYVLHIDPSKDRQKIKYDYTGIKKLNQLWLLDKKEVIVSCPNCFQSNKTLIPFTKNEQVSKRSKQVDVYGWNNAYQSLKHDRVKFQKFGSLKYLFDILSALYLLNIYAKDIPEIPLGKDENGMSFSRDFGSDIFSINLSRVRANNVGEKIKPSDFDSSVYFIDHTKDSQKKIDYSSKAFNVELHRLVYLQPRVKLHLEQYPDDSTLHLMVLGKKALGEEGWMNLFHLAQKNSPVFVDIDYRAILNKNQI